MADNDKARKDDSTGGDYQKYSTNCTKWRTMTKIKFGATYSKEDDKIYLIKRYDDEFCSVLGTLFSIT